MGRPLNKRYFGNPEEREGKQIKLSEAWIPGASAVTEDAWIDRQRGMGFYATDGTYRGMVRLVAGGAPLKKGEARIEVTPFGGGATEHAKRISGRKVLTHEGKFYKWSKKGAAAKGEADLPME